LRAFRSLRGLRNGASFGEWVNAILRREAQRWTGRETRRATADEKTLSIVGGVWPPPAQAADEVTAGIRAALRVLSARERQITVLHYLDGLTCEEIGAGLRLPVGSVKRILHNSRRKARKEAQAMMQIERRCPRRLSYWMSGEVPHGEWDAMARLRPALAQAICLSVNKQPKSVAGIAEEVQSHADYVGDAVGDLVRLELLTSPKKDRYLLNFIAFDAEDWRKLAERITQPGAEISHRLGAAQESLADAFHRTPLAQSGWSWEDVSWAVNCEILAHRAVFRVWKDKPSYPIPTRPGGFPYWLGGYESSAGGFHADSVAWCGTDRGGWGIGHFGPSMDHRGYTWVFDPPAHGRAMLYTLLDGSITEDEIASSLAVEDRERYQGTLAKLVEARLAGRREDGRYQLTFPVWRSDDSDIMKPVVDKVARPLVYEVLVPTWAGLYQVLDDMGYGHSREQYPIWQDWLFSFILGEAIRFMVKQGALPELGEQPPAKWNFLAWKGELPLFSLSVAA